MTSDAVIKLSSAPGQQRVWTATHAPVAVGVVHREKEELFVAAHVHVIAQMGVEVAAVPAARHAR